MASDTLLDLLDSDPSEPAPAPARIASRYTVRGVLGVGGTGVVYRVHDGFLDDIVALKRLKPALANQAPMLQRLRHEVLLSRRILHPHVVRSYDLGHDEDGWYLTMECVPGGPLSHVIAESGGLSMARALVLVNALCEGASAIHAAGWAHCDLKPDNVLVHDERVVITDLGIARPLGASGQVAGTPGYAAPEQLTGAPVDQRTDIFALGALVAELLTGRPPFSRGATEPDLRGIEGDVQQVLRQALSRERSRRPASARELSSMLLAATSHATVAQLGQASLVPLPGALAVAVLPFVAVDVPEDLAGGVGVELATRLSSSRGLRVRRVATDDGQGLDADVSVEGALRGDGDAGFTLALRARSLVDGLVVWSARRDVGSGDMVDSVGALASVLAEALTTRLSPGHAEESGDARAESLYLRGRHRLLGSWEIDPGDAVPLLMEAAERRPDDGRVLASLALARVRQAFWAREHHEQLLADARQAAVKAVHRTPDLGDAWAALAMVHRFDGNTPAGIRALVRALAVSPGLAWAHETVGAVLFEAGELSVARRHLQASIGLDPTSALAPMELQRLAAYAGDWDRVRAIAEEAPVVAMRVYGSLFTLRYRIWRGERVADPALAARLPADPLVEALRETIASGRAAPGLAGSLAEAVAAGTDRMVSLRTQVACEILAVYGDAPGALRLLADAVDTALEDRTWVRRCPALASIRDEAGFEDLAKEVDARADRVLEAYREALEDVRASR